MEQQNKRCSCEKHKEEIAFYFCKNCNIYMCNKCYDYHSKLFQNHVLFKVDNDNQEIFSGFCNEQNHFEILEFFCKNHNKLCCSSCICRMKNKKYGTHKDCDICFIDDIKQEKKSKLQENLKKLEEISKNIEESLNSMKDIYEKINEKKEDLKLKVQKIFTKIRNELNNREDELLLQIEQKYEEFYIKEEKIKEIEKLPIKIKASIEKGNLIVNKEWDNDDKLNIIINDCINIENNIRNIDKINNSIIKFNGETNIIFYPTEENMIISFLESINKFGEICIEGEFLSHSKIINNNKEDIKSIQKWINPENKNIMSELLYSLSNNGENKSKFHELCDNKGSTLTLFQIKDGDKVGIFTSKSWDIVTKTWKEDEKIFIFNLNQGKKYLNIRKRYSIFCDQNYGPYTDYFGINNNKSMKSLYHDAININNTYENGANILPSNGKAKYYDLIEVEVYKISFKDN